MPLICSAIARFRPTVYFMIPNTVKILAFDAAGTIIEPYPAVHHAYCEVAKSFGFVLDPLEIKQRFPNAMNHYFPLSWESQTTRTNQDQQWTTWRGLVSEVLQEIPADKIEPVFVALWDHFRQPQHWLVYPDVASTLLSLKQRGYIMCAVSNFDQRLYDIAKDSPDLSCIDHWFASVDVGYQKPCVEFFRTVEERLGAASHQFLMVGDSLEADYRGAQNAGWHARWLQRNADQQAAANTASQQSTSLPTETIRSLHELL